MDAPEVAFGGAGTPASAAGEEVAAIVRWDFGGVLGIIEV